MLYSDNIFIISNLDIIALSISLPGVNVVNMDFSQHRFELDLKVNIVICLHKSAQMLPRQNQEMTIVSWHPGRLGDS